jgi:hypothetical protein
MKVCNLIASVALVALVSANAYANDGSDVTPPGSQYSCSQQASWGKCGESWMQDYCNSSCGRSGNANNGGSDPWWGGLGEPQSYEEWIALRYDGWF